MKSLIVSLYMLLTCLIAFADPYLSSPYEEGDGYELSATTLGKCDYFTSWETINISSIDLSLQDKQAVIEYENLINSALFSKEKEALDKQAL